MKVIVRVESFPFLFFFILSFYSLLKYFFLFLQFLYPLLILYFRLCLPNVPMIILIKIILPFPNKRFCCYMMNVKSFSKCKFSFFFILSMIEEEIDVEMFPSLVILGISFFSLKISYFALFLIPRISIWVFLIFVNHFFVISDFIIWILHTSFFIWIFNLIFSFNSIFDYGLHRFIPIVNSYLLGFKHFLFGFGSSIILSLTSSVFRDSKKQMSPLISAFLPK